MRAYQRADARTSRTAMMGWDLTVMAHSSSRCAFSQTDDCPSIERRGLVSLRRLQSDFAGDATWSDSPAAVCAGTCELWRRGSPTASGSVTASIAASTTAL